MIVTEYEVGLDRRDQRGSVARLFPDGRTEEFPLPDRSSRPHAVGPDRSVWIALETAPSST